MQRNKKTGKFDDLSVFLCIFLIIVFVIIFIFGGKNKLLLPLKFGTLRKVKNKFKEGYMIKSHSFLFGAIVL